MRDDQRAHDRAGRRVFVFVALAVLVIAIIVGRIVYQRWHTSPPGGDLAPIGANGPPQPAPTPH